jgi:hypothetical protein
MSGTDRIRTMMRHPSGIIFHDAKSSPKSGRTSGADNQLARFSTKGAASLNTALLSGVGPITGK